jgi:hypothetical protein
VPDEADRERLRKFGGGMSRRRSSGLSPTSTSSPTLADFVRGRETTRTPRLVTIGEVRYTALSSTDLRDVGR